VTVNQGAIQVTTTSGQGSGTVTVTNNGSFEINTGGNIANPVFASGNGVGGEGALFKAITTANSTNTGLITLESTNVVLGGASGTYSMEGGITNAPGVNANLILVGGSIFRISNINASKEVDVGSNGSITVSATELNVEATTLVYSNLILNGSEFSCALSDKSFGLSPSKFDANNITMSNGANMLLSHTFTFGGNRGIFLGPGGGDIGENTSAGTLSIPGAISGPGTLLIEADGAGAGTKFTGNNTFTGTCTVAAGASLTVGNAATAGTFGAGDTVNDGFLTVDRGGALTYAGAISGTGTNSFKSESGGLVTLSGTISTTGPLTISGAGTITFSGANTYSANTLINCQYFMANNITGSGTSGGTVTVGESTGGTFLGGIGIISGPVTVVAGNTLQPGNIVPTNSLGTLTINNSLTLQSGSATVINIDATVPSSSAVVGMTSVTYGGALTVNVIKGALAAGQTYHLFGAGSYNGTFDGGITLPALAGGLFWNTSNLSVNGTISVMTQDGLFNKPLISGTNVILSGTEGTASGTYSVLATTNLTTPVSSWNVLSTGNSFDSNGNFSVTNGINPNTPQEFFMIRQP
jgi:autotransporter-associated beta strand protein